MVDGFTANLRREHPELDPVHYSIVKGFLVGMYDLWRRRYGPVIPGDEQAGRILSELETTLRSACDNVRPPG